MLFPNTPCNISDASFAGRSFLLVCLVHMEPAADAQTSLGVFEIAGSLVTAEGCYVCRCSRLLHIFPSLGHLPASPHFSFWKCSMRGVPFSFLPLESNGRVETMEVADCWKDDCVLTNRTWLSSATSSFTKSNNVTLQFWDFYWTIPFSFKKKLLKQILSHCSGWEQVGKTCEIIFFCRKWFWMQQACAPNDETHSTLLAD